MNKVTFLLTAITLTIGSLIVLQFSRTEEFTNKTLANKRLSYGEYPVAETNLLVEDIYPVNNSPTNHTGTPQQHPTFTLGSYEQITNNIKYPDNPDDGTCTPLSVCGIYANKQIGNNFVYPLPAINIDCSRRVGYFLV
jgi:hypothetical protein